MIIILDLDYTLFDAAKFKKDIAGLIGIRQKQFNDSYQDYFKSKNVPYNAYKHLSYLVLDGVIDRQKAAEAKAALNLLLKKADSYVAQDASDLLAEIVKKGDIPYLVSYGDQIWQSLKIKNLAIRKYFRKIIITDKKKEICLDFLKKEKGGLVFINDNASELFGIQRRFSGSGVILVQGPYDHNTEHSMRAYNINQVKKTLYGNQ